MFFAEDTPEAASAVFHALFEDALFFKRRGTQFLPKSGEQVEAEHPEIHAAFTGGLTAVPEPGTLELLVLGSAALLVTARLSRRR